MQMMYWIILIVLAVLILVTIIATVVTIVKERKEYRKYELDEEYGIEDDYDDDDYDDDYEERRPSGKSKKQSRRRMSEEDDMSGESSPKSGKRRWKIVLEDTDTGEQYSFIFFDSLGIGRTTKEVAFEEFLSLPGDRKISKVHCAIVRSKDKLYLRDEGSKNHTFLNGKKIQKPIVIQKEDFIALGETELEVLRVLRETN
jgi:hypothetical protein